MGWPRHRLRRGDAGYKRVLAPAEAGLIKATVGQAQGVGGRCGRVLRAPVLVGLRWGPLIDSDVGRYLSRLFREWQLPAVRAARLDNGGMQRTVSVSGWLVPIIGVDAEASGGMEIQNLEAVLGTVHGLLVAEGMKDAAQLVRTYSARAEQVGYDNWNGGTEIWEIYFDVPPADYARLGSRRAQIEEQITARLKIVMEHETQDWYSAKIVPRRVQAECWRAESSNLPREVRVSIVDGLRLENVAWQGQLDDVEFLSRLYGLQELPSHDSRFKDAAGDIWQHCVNNDDWEAYWIFSDKRFALMDGSAEAFLRFLCETIHPVVRPDRDEVVKIASHYNDQLRPVGWEIFEEEHIGARARFAFRPLGHHGMRAVSRARTVAEALDAGWMAKAIERMERAIETDPELAIGTAKELVESCCKAILTQREVTFSRGADLNDLTKSLVKELQLVPDGVSDQAKGAENIRLILRNLTQLTHNLAQLRGLYGTGHGRDGQHRGLQPRHARLAVASAVAFIDFAADTYRQRQAIQQSEASARSR